MPTAPLAIPPCAAAVAVLALGAVVVAEMPEVKGTFDADETPAKATAWLVAVGIGVAVVFEGLRTLLLSVPPLPMEDENGRGWTYLSITCMTPLATIISVIVT